MQRVQFLLFAIVVSSVTLLAQETMQREVRLDPSTARPVQELGILLRQESGDKQPSVFMRISEDGPKGAEFKEGDIILSVNKKEVKSLKEFDKAYESVKVGTTAEFEVQREGKKMALSFKKPKPEPRKPVMIQRTQ